MRRIFIFLAIIIFISDLSAQINKFGVPSMKNYSTQVTQGTEYNWSIVRDKTGVVYIGNDNKGVLRYDGHNWSQIPVNKEPAIRVLGVSEDGVVYVGGSYEFGYIEPDGNGSPKYVSLSHRFDITQTDSSSSVNDAGKKKTNNVVIGEIYSIVIADTAVYFVSTESMFIYAPSNDSIEYINLRDFDLKQVVKVVKIGDRIIMSDNVNGLFELKDKKPVRIPGGEFFAMKISIVIMPYDENSLFIGTLTDGVYRLDLTTGKVSESVIDPVLNERLKSDQLYTAITTQSGDKILGTITEGIFVLDKNCRLIGKWDTKTTDMADNTITALYLGNDPGSELWIATAGHVTKAYVGQPFYEISTRTGYEGLVNVLTSFDDKMYLSTDLGLFRSFTGKDGLFSFERIGNINKQVFTLTIGEVGKEKFVLAGSNQGLFQIMKNGEVIKVDEVMNYPADAKKVGYSVRSLLQSRLKPDRFYMGLNSKGILISEYNGRSWSFIKQVKTGIRGYVSSIVENSDGDLIFYTGNPIGLYRLTANDTIPVEFTPDDGLSYALPTNLVKIGNEIVVTTTKGLFRLNPDSKKWLPYDELLGGYTKDLYCKDIYGDEEGDFWLTILEDRIYEILFKKDSLALTPFRGLLNTLPNLEKYDFKYLYGKYWMTKSKIIYVIDKDKLTVKRPVLNVLLSKITLGSDSLMMNSSFYETLSDGKNVPSLTNKSKEIPEVRYNYNSVSFFWTLPYFLDEESTLFSFRLDGFDKSWSKWEKIYYKDFTNLPFGKYTFRVRAKTPTDILSNEAVFEFYILKPWYLKGYMILLYTIAIVMIILFIIRAYTRKLKNENIRLEGIVAERTAVVVKQKEELESSIHYASRIQMALLPSEAILSENLKNYFILFKPRDIVSGDFYWMTKKENRLYIVAADCTGHGVPGAFMSLLGMSFLDEIIDKEKAPRADHILSELRHHVTESLKQSGVDNEAKDGMDIALLVIDFNVSRVEFSGAYNPCFRVRKLTEEEIRNNNEAGKETPEGSMSDGKYLLETIYASKMPIGISPRMDENFVFFDWDLDKGVSYYLFSDGYLDQFGGQKGRKFMKKNFKKYLLDIQDYPLNKQKELLEQNLRNWMGHSPQIDDILVMGIRTD